MVTEVMAHYGIRQHLHLAGYFETEHHRQIAKDVRAAIGAGRVTAVTGIVGSGKTLLLRRVRHDLEQEGRFQIAQSLAVDKDRVTLQTLMTALFLDLGPDRKSKQPPKAEHRERELCERIAKAKRPVVLFIDEAHDLQHATLIRLKRLMEAVVDSGGQLSLVLAGHPKLRNDLRRPTMEEIGSRSELLAFEGLGTLQREYIAWLIAACAEPGIAPLDVMTEDAAGLLASRLKTPLQIEHHLARALEEGFRVGEKPVTRDVVEAVLSRHLDDLEPRLTRHGYNVKILSEQFNAKPAELRLFMRGQLDQARSRELVDQMVAAGLPM